MKKRLQCILKSGIRYVQSLFPSLCGQYKMLCPFRSKEAKDCMALSDDPTYPLGGESFAPGQHISGAEVACLSPTCPPTPALEQLQNGERPGRGVGGGTGGVDCQPGPGPLLMTLHQHI